MKALIITFTASKDVALKLSTNATWKHCEISVFPFKQCMKVFQQGYFIIGISVKRIRYAVCIPVCRAFAYRLSNMFLVTKRASCQVYAPWSDHPAQFGKNIFQLCLKILAVQYLVCLCALSYLIDISIGFVFFEQSFAQFDTGLPIVWGQMLCVRHPCSIWENRFFKRRWANEQAESCQKLIGQHDSRR